MTLIEMGHRYAEETDTETLWRERYAHCDYGFYITLPPGFVGHGTHSPNPNHGFLVALPDVGRTHDVSTSAERFIWVNAEYNSFDLTSLTSAGNWASQLMAEEKTGFKETARQRVRLNNRPAIRIEGEYDGPQGRVVEEQIIALRAGILYEVGLTTRANNYIADKKDFEKILLGFHFWRIHYC
jgi:hypothetical protein